MLIAVLYQKNNKALIELLKRTETQAHNSRTRENLDVVIDDLKAFSGSYQFNMKAYWIAFAVFLLATAALTYWDWSRWQRFQQSTWIILAVGSVLTLVAGITAFYPGRLMTKASHALLQRDGLLDNDLSPAVFESRAASNEFQHRFSDFNRGNYKREIHALYDGSYSGSEYSFQYQYYHFHYVDERIVTETYTDSKGEVRTRRKKVYDHYDRYGLILPFGLLRNVAVVGFGLPGAGKATYKPASNRFNKEFKVVAASELEAAKAMKPTVVIAFEEFSEVLSQVNFEVNDAGDLCLSFADKDLIATTKEAKICDYEAFIEALDGEQEFAKLKTSLDFIHYVMTKLDSNF